MKKIWDKICKPPYPLLPWLVWLYVPVSCLLLPYGGVFTGHIFGFDDHVRLVQVINWINGAGFYDRTIMRANPPEGFTTIWSRIVDIPLAILIIAAQQFMAQKKAVLVAAAIMPLVQLGFLFSFAAPYFARPLVGKNKSRLLVLFLIFTSLTNFKFFSISGFLVGEASHHPYYVILYMLMFGAAARMAMGSTRADPVYMIGICVALLTAIGIEGYPMIAGMVFLLAAAAWAFNRPIVAARGGDGLLYAAMGALLLLPMHQPPQNWFMVSFAEPSILGVLLVGIAGLFLKIENLVVRRFKSNRAVSAVILGFVAVVTAAVLVAVFPDMLNGAAAGLSPAERQMALSEHYEAKSIWGVSYNLVDFIGLSMPIAIALVAGVYAIIKAKGPRRKAVNFCYLGFAILGGGMANLFSRYYHHAMTTASVWLLWVWEKLKSKFRKNTQYGLWVLGSFIALGPFWMLLLPAIQNNVPLTSQLLLFPAAMQTSPDPCESMPMTDYINNHYDKNTLVMDPYWLSAQLLFELDTRVDFIANYPSHDKFIDNYAFYLTTHPEVAQEIAARHGIDLVLVCTQNPQMHDLDKPDTGKPFVMLLQSGHVPNWLKMVHTGLDNRYRLYEVDKKLVQGAP